MSVSRAGERGMVGAEDVGMKCIVGVSNWVWTSIHVLMGRLDGPR